MKHYALRYGAVAVLIGLLLYWTRDEWHEYERVRSLSLTALVELSLLFIVYQLLSGVVLREFMAAFGVRLSFREWFGLVCIRSLGNYLPLSAGWTANAVYFKFKRDFPLASFAVLMAGNLVLALLTAGLMGTVLLAIHFATTGAFQPLLFLVYAGIVVLSVFVLFVPVPRSQRAGWIGSALGTLHAGWLHMRSHPGLIGRGILLQVASQAAAAFQYVIVCRALGIDLTLTAVFILSISTTVIQIATLVPGNLGVREAIAGAVAASFGVPFNAGFLAAAVTRVVNLLWIFVLGTIFAFALPIERRNHDAAE